MDEDSIAILTLPYSNDLSALNTLTNNVVALVLLSLQVVLLIGLVVISFLVPHYWQSNFDSKFESNLLNPYSVVLYCHLVLWLMTVLIEFYMKNYYYKRLQIVGYHKHHRLVIWLGNVPAILLNKANVVLLLVTTIVYKFGDENGTIVTTPVHWLQGVETVVVAIILPFLLKQLYHEIKFRKAKNPPDIFCVDDPQHLQHNGLNEVGLRSSTYLEDLLEKQADLIYNLKSQNSHLRMMLFKLSQRRSSSNLTATT